MTYTKILFQQICFAILEKGYFRLIIVSMANGYPVDPSLTSVDDSRWQSRGSTTVTESRACVYTTADDSASGRLSSTVADCSF